MNYRELAKKILVRVAPPSIYSSINARVAARDIASGRRYEPEIAMLGKFIKEGDSVIDIGANHGLYAYHFSRLVGEAGRVFSFEPLPPNLRILHATVKRLGLNNVDVIPEACGQELAQTTFCIPLLHGVPQLGWAHEGSDGVKFECNVVRVDEKIHSRVSFMKLDVEGAELFALRGAERILREFHPVILLEADNHTERFGYEQQAVFDYLGGFGYRSFKGNLEPSHGFTGTGNYFFIA